AKGAGERPKPLYMRGADAKPQAGFILSRQER
ncbi:tRNA (adenosine(37)-N6)-threonylcarbamoyltransferase complex dimerization subunit type 1 TsaB, partial [Mesorhizobium sp. M7A.T.Ca.TU.009.02.1.1]